MLPKLRTRVRFPSPARTITGWVSRSRLLRGRGARQHQPHRAGPVRRGVVRRRRRPLPLGFLMRLRLGLLVSGAFMILASCGGSGGTGSSATSASVRPGSATEDLVLLQTITADMLTSSGLEVKKRIVDTDTMRCTGTSTSVDSGRRATITRSVTNPGGDVVTSLGKVVPAMRPTRNSRCSGYRADTSTGLSPRRPGPRSRRASPPTGATSRRPSPHWPARTADRPPLASPW